MRIRYLKRFENRFRRLSFADKKSVKEIIDTFIDSPSAASPGTHALRGTMTGLRSLAVDDDLRIIFKVRGDYDEVVFLDVGTHDDVYRA
jgi:addiction module RelE/StbE family toxin